MAVQDLREWIARVDDIGELTSVDGADPATEIGGIVDLHMQDAGNPAVLFDRIVGHPAGHRLIANVLTSYPRVALTLGLSPELGPRELVLACRAQSRDLAPIAAETVEWGPVLEHQDRDHAVDTSKFPAPVWHAGDGGRYIGTGCIVVMRDPDSGWVNAGTYRVQQHDEQTLGIYISAGKHGRMIRDKYWARGQACPVAVSVGQDPLLLMLGGLIAWRKMCERPRGVEPDLRESHEQ